MKSISLLAPLVVCLITTSCTNTVVVVQPSRDVVNAVGSRADQPCILGQDGRGKYANAVPTTVMPPQIPQEAKDARVDGCAGVAFQLDLAGTPTNLTTVRESPTGFGFALALRNALLGDQFKSTSDADQWYYVSSAMITSTMPPKP
jgi:hypothetical protein